jgi:hypothetical protein
LFKINALQRGQAMKAMRWVKTFYFILIVGVLALGPGSLSYAQPLPEASCGGGIQWSVGSFTGDYITADHAGIYSGDWFIKWNDPGMPYVSSYVATLHLTNGSHPIVDIQGSAKYVGGTAKASGLISYYVRADKKDPYDTDAPDWAQLLVTSRGSFTVSNTSDCYASVYSYFGTPSNPKQDRIIDISTTYYGAHWEVSQTITEYVRVGVIYAIQLAASGKVQHNWETSGDFQAIIDPMVQIDPEWMVDYKGRQVPGTQLYSVTFSSGFKSVPLPGVLMLLLD